ncbi:MAG: tyrosine-type recombinase/integrase [Bacteroidota bacterium]
MDVQMQLASNAFATRKSYLRGIRALILHYRRLPEDCTVDELKAFLIHQRDQGHYSSSTLNLRVCALKYYFREVVHRLDLVVKIPNPRISKFDVEVLTIEEIKRMQRVCRDVRQLLVLNLLYDTGLRVREVVRLRISDFDKHHRTITIRNSKGNKTRVVQYGTALRQTMKSYCKVRGGVPKDTLLESIVEAGQPLSKRGVQHIVRQIVKRSGIKKRVSPQTLRHTYAVHYLNAGGTLRQLQVLLGHEYLSTTLHYLKYANPDQGKRVSVLDTLEQSKQK